MKAKHFVVMALLLLGANACSDDDEQMDDPCQNACAKLAACGTGVACDGVTLETGRCIEVCRQGQALGAANCVIQVPQCSQIDKLQNCAAQMPCP